MNQFDDNQQHLSKILHTDFTPYLGDPRMIIGENPKKVCNIESLTVNHVILTINFLLCNFINLWKDSHMLSIHQHLELVMTCNSLLYFNVSSFISFV